MNKRQFSFSLLRQVLPFLLLGVELTMVQPSQASPFAFDATSSLNQGREFHTATLLANGKVLVVGGLIPPSNTFASVELFDPSSGTWAPTGSLSRARLNHTATLLPNGKVLVVGGRTAFGGEALTSCEIYDPSSGTWTATGDMHTVRDNHTATLLPDGRVLAAGGAPGGFYNLATVASAEVYDPSNGLWTTASTPNRPRDSHTATLLPNGKVLLAGGENMDGELESAELYDPSTGTWTFTGNLKSSRSNHVGTLLSNGKVLIAGGYVASSELYDPSTGIWTLSGNMITTRRLMSATLLPNGKVLVAGGDNNNTSLASAELYDPSTGTWQATGSLAMDHFGHTATLLPTGKVLIAGGAGNTGLKSCELFDASSGGWTATANAGFARALHTATILPNGQVLAAGGTNGSATLGSAEIYDPPTAQWSSTTSLNGARSRHTATLLPNGKVLVAGGASGSVLATAELYDRSNTTWTSTGNLNTSRYEHTATLLPNGKVLVTGGVRTGGVPPATIYVATAELYDPASGNWTFTGSMATGRHNHTATLLPSGKVLVTGGSNANNNFLATCELYDPSTGAWSATGSMANPRELHTATLLPREQVLVAGGSNDGNAQGIFLDSVEIYNPATGAWVTVPSLSTARVGHSATLLADGRVLVYAGLGNGSTYLTSAELYDPSIAKWYATGSSSAARFRHTATFLPNGRVLAVGGYFGNGTPNTSTSLYDPGFAFLRPAWQPQISSALLNSASDGPHLFVTGSRFQGISQASGGTTQDSSTNYPVLQIRRIDNNQEVLLLPDPAFGWSDQLFESTVINGFPFGPALVTVFANGIPSDARYLLIGPSTTPDPTPTPTATPTATPTSTPGLVANVATRLPVGTGDDVLIEGFTVLGPAGSTKKIIVRATGPSLATCCGVADALPNPTLEIHDANSNNATVATNDDWRNTQPGGLITGDQSAEIAASGAAPSEDLESAIIADLAPGSYTAVVRGAGNTTGTGVVDAYDLSGTSQARLANIATRGLIQPGDKLMIAGFIIQNAPVRAVVSAIGPSLSAFGIGNALPDTTLQLRDSNGAIVRENDDWQTDQKQELESTGLQPTNDLEAALVATIPPGQYTAQVRGKPETTGIGVVQIYFLQ